MVINRPMGSRSQKTKWEPYGSEWAPGHEPPKPVKTYAPATASIAEKLGALTWQTNEGVSHDAGLGFASGL